MANLHFICIIFWQYYRLRNTIIFTIYHHITLLHLKNIIMENWFGNHHLFFSSIFFLKNNQEKNTPHVAFKKNNFDFLQQHQMAGTIRSHLHWINITSNSCSQIFTALPKFINLILSDRDWCAVLIYHYITFCMSLDMKVSQSKHSLIISVFTELTPYITSSIWISVS